MEEFFKAAAQQPVPTRARLGRWLFYDVRLSADHRSRARRVIGRRTPFLNLRRSPRVSTPAVARARRLASSTWRRARCSPMCRTIARSCFSGTAARPVSKTRCWGQSRTPRRWSRSPGHGRTVFRNRRYRPGFATSQPTNHPAALAAALADYVRTRMSGNAPYDRWPTDAIGGRSRNRRSAAARCSSSATVRECHAGFNFSDGRLHNLGVWTPA